MANTHSLDLETTSSQYASRTDTASLSVTGDFTIELWVKYERFSSDVLVSKYDWGSNERSYILDTGGSKLRIRYAGTGDGSDTVSISSTDVLTGTNGVWYHYAVAVDVSAKSATMYVDGSSVSVAASSGTATSVEDNGADFAIGAQDVGNTPAGFLDAKVDEVRLWSDIRTGQEIADNYQLELDGDEANLEGYWKFNNDYTDETSNSNDLTASGSPVFSTDVPFVGTALSDVIGPGIIAFPR